MDIIEIREDLGRESGVRLRIGRYEFSATVDRAFGKKLEDELNWYFEQYYLFPFADHVRAREAGRSIISYGEFLFRQLFTDEAARDAYVEVRRRSHPDNMAIEIFGGPTFQGICWESLKDPRLPLPFSVTSPIFRRGAAGAPPLDAEAKESPTLNLLVVTARPAGAYDVGYRTITRPLINVIKNSRLPVNVEFVRPGTWKALSNHLQTTTRDNGSGYYHAIHLDLHGQLLKYSDLAGHLPALSQRDKIVFRARWGHARIEPYEGLKAFLHFEPDVDEQFGITGSEELSSLLLEHKVPIAILNACQSGKQVGDQETSLAESLIAAGVQSSVAMAWTVTVTAAEIMIPVIYGELLKRRSLAEAVRAGRRALYDDKKRRAAFNAPIELDDWVLPVVYQNAEPALRFKDLTADDIQRRFERLADASSPPYTKFGFRGRDLDVLNIEKLILRQNVLLVKGMGGSGKTTLLRHLANWWETTNLVVRSFYFGWDARAWTVDMILNDLAPKVLNAAELTAFSRSTAATQVQIVASAFRDVTKRYLLILDNVESITSNPLAIHNNLIEPERGRLCDFLRVLSGGSSLVLLGSRTDETWLSEGTFDNNIYALGGLDKEAASDLADAVLERVGAREERRKEPFTQLMELLSGYPLAIEVILPNLAEKPTETVLQELRQGLKKLDSTQTGDLVVDKTTSILACVEYSHVNLDPISQRHLQCLAPFSSVIDLRLIKRYSEFLSKESPFEGFDVAFLNAVTARARLFGLMQIEPTDSKLLRPHPLLTWFLNNRFLADQASSTQIAVESAFQQLYDAYAEILLRLQQSDSLDDRGKARRIINTEFTNFGTALRLALKYRRSIKRPFQVLMWFLDEPSGHSRALELGKEVLDRLSLEPSASEAVPPDLEVEQFAVMDAVAGRLLALAQPKLARDAYNDALGFLERITALSDKEKRRLSASLRYMIGVICIIDRRFQEAEENIRSALQINVEYNNELQIPDCLHQLAIIEWERLKFEAATQYCNEAITKYTKTRSLDRSAAPHGLKGHILYEQGKFNDAVKQYQVALGIYQKYQDNDGVSSSYYAIGRAKLECNETDEARRCLQRALEIKLDGQFPSSSTALNHMMLGLLAEKEQKYEEADGQYLKAVELLAKTGDYYNVNMAIRGCLRLASRDSKRLQIVVGQLRQLLPSNIDNMSLDQVYVH